MKYVVTGKEAKEIDGISIEEIGIPSFALMERASLAVADSICHNTDVSLKRVLVFCGVGNNGGDGIAVGRILFDRGYFVSLVVLGKLEKATKEMACQLKIAQNLGIPIFQNPSLEDMTEFLEKTDIMIDALFGIGLSREIQGEFAQWIQVINQCQALVYAVDIPSGIDASTGKVWGIAVKADYTVTFGFLKSGLLLFPGKQYSGTVEVADIGFPQKAVEQVNPSMFSYEREDVKTLFPKRKANSHKGSYGKTLVIAGSESMSGAAYFSGAAAYGMGSGLVKILTHENNRIMLQTKLPEALLTTYGAKDMNPDSQTDHLASISCYDFMKKVKEEIQWASVIIIGPGLSTCDFSKMLLITVLQEMEQKPVVIDADGINLLSQLQGDFFRDGKWKLPKNIVLTPHLKEMSRLLKRSVKEIQKNLLETAKTSVEGATLVLKDARTLVNRKDSIYINLSGNNALAKGGSGDVLSGIIGGLLALGMSCQDAACLGVYLHGLTASEYVKNKSISSMTASDILEELSRILP